MHLCMLLQSPNVFNTVTASHNEVNNPVKSIHMSAERGWSLSGSRQRGTCLSSEWRTACRLPDMSARLSRVKNTTYGYTVNLNHSGVHIILARLHDTPIECSGESQREESKRENSKA